MFIRILIYLAYGEVSLHLWHGQRVAVKAIFELGEPALAGNCKESFIFQTF